MNSQPQLLQIALDKKDVVYTPDWVARDMVEFFKPTGRILEPFAGEGAILKYLSGADWFEINKGKDFLSVTEHYDWIISNPPYGRLAKWIRFSFGVADNIVYLIPMHYLFVSTSIMKAIHSYGGIKHIHVYDEKNFKDWSIGFAIGAVHFQKDYHGGMAISYA
jgi:hypothetical protein